MQGALSPALPIAVIGMAARFAGAGDVEQYWANLIAGVESVSQSADGEARQQAGDAPGAGNGHFVPAVGKVSGTDWFDADYFRVPPAEALIMDPQHRVLLEVAAEALEDAAYAGERDAVVGVFAGCGENHYFHEFVAPAGHTGDIRVTLGNEKDFLAPRLAFKLGLTGPAITVQTGCATALTAVALACTSLAAGDCDIALAGGVSLIMPDVNGYTRTDGGIHSADGHCRSFDAEASGAVPGSGAGIVVLRRDADAQAARDNRRAVIRGWAVNNDGGSRIGFTAPNVDGQETVIRAALTRAGIRPSEIGYMEAHGTGTAIGDPVEFEALRRVFAGVNKSAHTCTLGAVKPNIGHTDAAAGVAGLIKATLAVERAVIPGTLHFRTPNPEIDLTSTPFVLTAQTRSWEGDEPRIAGVSAFGLGGSNAHVVLQSVPAAPASSAVARSRQVLALSARSDEELARMRERLAGHLAKTASPDASTFADVAYTLAVGKARFSRRWAAVATSHTEAVLQLQRTPETSQPVARWSLVIDGTPRDLTEMGERLLVTEPLLRPMLTELTGNTSLHDLPPERAGALTAVCIARILGRLGLTFSRVDAPSWALPVARWLSASADTASLAAALAACTPATSAGSAPDSAGSAREAPSTILVSASFDLADVVARAWRAGASIDWTAYFRGEPRSRVQLPTYPFTHRRFWLARPETGPDGRAPGRYGGARVGQMDILSYVEEVWRDVLGVEHIEPDAHFVNDLSGDSLWAVEIGARLNEGLGLDLPLDVPFITPTIAATAALIEQNLATEASS
jgi:phthiocerol/phenolphthiocerol synthesis type-I polyketide synthase E